MTSRLANPLILIILGLIGTASQSTNAVTKFYEGESTVHSIAVQQPAEKVETPSFVFATSIETKEPQITIFKTQVWYSSKKAFEVDLMPPADISCFNQKSPDNAEQEDCVMVSALTARGFNFDSGSLVLKDASYNFKGTDSRYFDETKQSQYLEAAKTNPVLPLENVKMTVEVIDKSSYFLYGVSSGFGLFRWETGNTGNYAEISLEGMMTAGTGSVDRFFKDIKVIPNSKWALISFYGWRSTAVVDFITMEIITKMVDSGSGQFAVLQKDPSLSYFAKAGGTNIQLMRYSDGTEEKSFKVFYFLTAIEAVYQSHMIFVAEDTIIKVYNLDDQNPTALYSYDTTEGVYSLKLDHKAGVVLVGGSTVGQYISINEPLVTECHPNCEGGCTKGFSPSHCSNCAVSTEPVGGTCSLKTVGEIEGGNLDYANAQWSKPTVEPKAPAAEDKTFIEKLTGEYRNMLIIVIGLLGVCAICCCAKWLCSSKEANKVAPSMEMKKHRRGNNSGIFDKSFNNGRE